jgi:hypothetical protein
VASINEIPLMIISTMTFLTLHWLWRVSASLNAANIYAFPHQRLGRLANFLWQGPRCHGLEDGVDHPPNLSGESSGSTVSRLKFIAFESPTLFSRWIVGTSCRSAVVGCRRSSSHSTSYHAVCDRGSCNQQRVPEVCRLLAHCEPSLFLMAKRFVLADGLIVGAFGLQTWWSVQLS